MHAAAADWFVDRSSRSADWPISGLHELTPRPSVSVVLPALNEASTVGALVRVIRRELIDQPSPLVDELVVLDSGSVDQTADVARDAGAVVVHRDDVLPQLPSVPGKGEALWRGLAATTGDIVVFVDADLLSFRSTFVTGLLGPLFADETVQIVKASYDRPLADGTQIHPGGGGRVTELVARPLLNLHWPELAGFVQPLAGEYAARRSLLEQLPFPTGYGVEIGLLIDAYSRIGLSGMAQVDLGERRHRHHDDQRLGRMAAEVWQTVLSRLLSGVHGQTVEPTLTQFVRDGDLSIPVTHEVTALERPPLVSMAEYDRNVAR
ncbi:MAG TPA: glucosyl-3-phosphoglycerate synthase [Actinomycetes bacterium]|nr:glucosyl-3-phosphoglycerate synthase [Actinomycetes bacterium]